MAYTTPQQVQDIVKQREKKKKQLIDAGLSEKSASSQALAQENALQNALDAQAPKVYNPTADQLAAAANVGKVQPTAPTTRQDITTPQPAQPGTVPAALKNIAPDIASEIIQSTASGAGLGALAGSAVGGVGAVPGAVIGAAGGAIKGGFSVVSKLKLEQRQNVKVEFKNYSDSVKNIKSILDGVNKGTVDSIEAVDLYNRELEKIDAAEVKLKILGEHEWLSKAKDELVQIQSFNDVQRQKTATALQQAILNPDPKKVYFIDIPTDTTSGASDAEIAAQ